MSGNIAVKSIVIKIGDKELAFSVEDARELKEALDALFGKEIIKEIRDNWYYQQPSYVQPSIPGNGWSYTTTGTFPSGIGGSITVANCTPDGQMWVNANQLCDINSAK